MHLKFVEMHLNAVFVKPGCPKQGHISKYLQFDGIEEGFLSASVQYPRQ